MDPDTAKHNLCQLMETLPDDLFYRLVDQGIHFTTTPSDITCKYGFVGYETGNIYIGIWRVLSGTDSPDDFLAFVQKDDRIEDDNRHKIPAIARETRSKLFDPVLPILKAAGRPVKY